MNRLVFIFFSFLFPFLLFAQDNTEITPYIEVTGYAQMSVAPDIFNLQIVLKEYLDGKFKVTVSEQETKMKNMFKIAGVDMSKLRLKNLDNDYVVVINKENNATTEKIYILTLTTLPMLTSTLQVLSDLNINDAQIISATHSQIDTYRQSVRTSAVQDAKDRANSLLKSFGNRVGKPLIIREYEFYPYGEGALIATEEEINEYIVEDEYVLAFKKIRIQSAIFVRFAIEGLKD
jgi:hypothetical protein